MKNDPDIIDLGAIRLERDGTDIQILDRYGEEAIGYLEHVLDGASEWEAIRARVLQ